MVAPSMFPQEPPSCWIDCLSDDMAGCVKTSTPALLLALRLPGAGKAHGLARATTARGSLRASASRAPTSRVGDVAPVHWTANLADRTGLTSQTSPADWRAGLAVEPQQRCRPLAR